MANKEARETRKRGKSKVDENLYGEMPSKDEELLNYKPPKRIMQDERSMVAQVHDLMKKETSMSASSSASKHFLFLSKIFATIAFPYLICLSRFV